MRYIMSERHDRLTQAFLQSGLSLEQVLERGINPNTFRSNRSGNMPFSFKAAKQYARLFKVSPTWLYEGVGPMIGDKDEAPRLTIPVISWVAAGQLADMDGVNDNSDETIMVSGLPLSDYFATVVRGDSMDRISPEGSMLIVDANDKRPRSGRPYIFSLRGETTYKVYQSEPVARLEPLSTNPAHKTIFLNDDDWHVVGRVVRSWIDL